MTQIHVIPSEEGGWDVTHGRCRVVRHKTREQAIKEAKNLAASESAELILHGRDGHIEKTPVMTN